MAIGNQIKALRKSLGLTQQTFADKLFISYQSVSNWERAKSHPTAEMMLTIIETFHLPLNFFMPSDQNSQDLDDEQLILAAFIKSMRASADKIPTWQPLPNWLAYPLNASWLISQRSMI